MTAALVGVCLIARPAASSAQSQPAQTQKSAKTKTADSTRTIPRFDQPKWVMLRSLVVPGWGQFHNHAWWKGAGIAAAEVGVGLRLLDDKRTLDRLEQQINQAPNGAFQDALISDYNSRVNGYVSRQWLFGAVLAYSLLDAYIDAHFRNFKFEFETDPALKGNDKPDAGVRVSLRWDF